MKNIKWMTKIIVRLTKKFIKWRKLIRRNMQGEI